MDVTSEAAVYHGVRVFLCGHAFISLGSVASTVAGCVISRCLVFKETAELVPRVAVPFYIPTRSVRASSSSFLSEFFTGPVVSNLVCAVVSNLVCAVMACCGLNWRFQKTHEVKHLICHSCVFFSKCLFTSIPVFNWILCFSLVSFENSLYVLPLSLLSGR